jgi:hypothetical protein
MLPNPMLPHPMLPNHTLPNPMLPNRALLLIHEYSRPMTRPDWRKSKPVITTFKLYVNFKERRESVLVDNVLNNIRSTDWYYKYNTIQQYGLQGYFRNHISEYGIPYNPAINIYKIDGISDAIRRNNLIYSYYWY